MCDWHHAQASVEVAENDMMDIGVVRAIMLARIQSLLSAKNVRAEIVEVMGKILNAGFAPVVSASTPSPLVAIAQGISGHGMIKNIIFN